MKGVSLDDMKGYALALVLVAIIVGVSASILLNIHQTQCLLGVAGTGATGVNPSTGLCYTNATTIASNSTSQGLTGENTMATWLPIIAVIVAASVVVGIIIAAFR